MTTQNKENYGRDVRTFHHPEDDMSPVSEINNAYITNPDSDNESYVDQYQKDNDEEDDEEIVNQDDDIINNEDQDELENKFSSENNFEDDLDEDINQTDIDDDLEEDYNENDREIDNFSTDKKRDILDLEYDIDQDLEETDPVNNPRKF